MLNATAPGNRFCKLRTRKLEYYKTRKLQDNAGKLDRKFKLTDDIKHELSWWIHNMEDVYDVIVRPGPSMVMNTDASLTGWGCRKSQQVVVGRRRSRNYISMY